MACKFNDVIWYSACDSLKGVTHLIANYLVGIKKNYLTESHNANVIKEDVYNHGCYVLQHLCVTAEFL